jgi:hypothetical protein
MLTALQFAHNMCICYDNGVTVVPILSRKACLFDALAAILATTNQEKVAITAFRAMRELHPRGSLFIVKPNIVADRDSTVRLDDIRSQVYRDLDRGLPYSAVARALRIDHRRVLRLKRDWDQLMETTKEMYRDDWSEERQRQRETLELGRAEANARSLERIT